MKSIEKQGYTSFFIGFMPEESGLWSLRLGDFGLAVQLQPEEELRGIEAGRMADPKRWNRVEPLLITSNH